MLATTSLLLSSFVLVAAQNNDQGLTWTATPYGAERSPCPAFNIMANYGLISRTEPIPKQKVLDLFQQYFSVDASGDAGIYTLANMLGMGNSTHITLAQVSLHDKMEHDASLARQDAFFGDYMVPDFDLLDEMATFSSDGLTMTAKDLGKYRHARFQHSKKNNKDFLFTPISETAAYIEAGTLLAVLDPINHRPSLEVIREFLGFERFPNGWTKSAGDVSFAVSYLSAEVKWYAGIFDA